MRNQFVFSPLEAKSFVPETMATAAKMLGVNPVEKLGVIEVSNSSNIIFGDHLKIHHTGLHSHDSQIRKHGTAQKGNDNRALLPRSEQPEKNSVSHPKRRDGYK